MTPASKPTLTLNTEQKTPVTHPVHELDEWQLCLVEKKESCLWNEYIQRYHYLGYTPLPGAQLRYFVRMGGRF